MIWLHCSPVKGFVACITLLSCIPLLLEHCSYSMLHNDPKHRSTAEKALSSPFFSIPFGMCANIRKTNPTHSRLPCKKALGAGNKIKYEWHLRSGTTSIICLRLC